MAMRAQISLQFDDADLFQNFVTPYKEGRVLNSLIIKCLSAYYYNEEVRNLIEGTSIEDATDGESVQTNQSLCDNIRASLLMQDFLASELQNTINNGTEDIDNILNKTNDLARKSGVAKHTDSEYGSNMLQITMSDAKSVSDLQKHDATIGDSNHDAAFSILVNAVLKLAEASGNNEVVSMLHSSSSDNENNEHQVVNENQSFSNVSEVSSSSNVPTNELKVDTISSVSVNEDFSTEEVIPTANDFDDDSSVSEIIESTSNIIEDTDNSSTDASDYMKELLGSL